MNVCNLIQWNRKAKFCKMSSTEIPALKSENDFLNSKTAWKPQMPHFTVRAVTRGGGRGCDTPLKEASVCKSSLQPAFVWQIGKFWWFSPVTTLPSVDKFKTLRPPAMVLSRLTFSHYLFINLICGVGSVKLVSVEVDGYRSAVYQIVDRSKFKLHWVCLPACFRQCEYHNDNIN